MLAASLASPRPRPPGRMTARTRSKQARAAAPMAARPRWPGWWPVSAAMASSVRVPAKAAAVSGSGEPADGHVDEGERDGQQDQPRQRRQLPHRGCAGSHDGQGEPGGQLGQQQVRADPGAAAGAAAGNRQQRPPPPAIRQDLLAASRARTAGRQAGFDAAGEHTGAYPRACDHAGNGRGDDPRQCRRIPYISPNASMRHNHSPGAGSLTAGGRPVNLLRFSNEMPAVSAWADGIRPRDTETANTPTGLRNLHGWRACRW